MRPAAILRLGGYVALGAVPLAYRHVPGLPPFLRGWALLASGTCFAAALLAQGDSAAGSPPWRRAARWAAAWVAWAAASALWAEHPWSAGWPVLQHAACLAVAAGIATDPSRLRGLRFTAAGWGLAAIVYGTNLWSGGALERLAGNPLQGDPIDHLPFGNRNAAALLFSALLPALLASGLGDAQPGVRGRRASAAALLCLAATAAILLSRTRSAGACTALAAAGLLVLALRFRRALPILGGIAVCGAAWMGIALAKRPAPPWRLETTFGIRTLAWEAALRGARERPWTGQGSGQFALAFPRLRPDAYPLSIHATPRALHAYNFPLQALCEGGIPGACLLLAAMAALLSALAGAPARRAWPVATLLVHSLGGDALVEPLGLSLLAAGCGWAAGDGAPRLWRPCRPLAAIGLLAAALPVLALEGAHLDRHRAAHASWRRGDLPEASALWERASRLGVPSTVSLDALYHRGKALFLSGRIAEASGAFEALMARGGSYGNAPVWRARAAIASGRRTEALGLLRDYLAFLPCDVPALRLLAEARPEDPLEPERRLWETARALPDRHPALVDAARWRRDLGDWEGAWRLWRRVCRGRPDDRSLLGYAVESGVRAGRVPEALALVRSAPPPVLAALLAELDAAIAADPGPVHTGRMRALIKEALAPAKEGANAPAATGSDAPSPPP